MTLRSAATTPLRGKPFPTFIVEDRGHDTPCHIWQGATNSKGYPMRIWNGKGELGWDEWLRRHEAAERTAPAVPARDQGSAQ